MQQPFVSPEVAITRVAQSIKSLSLKDPRSKYYIHMYIITNFLRFCGRHNQIIYSDCDAE